MTAVTPTDRPKSVRNSYLIKVFGGVFMLSRCFLDCSVGVGGFVTGLSEISSFFSQNCENILSKVFRSTARQPTQEVGSIKCGCSRTQKNY